MIEIPSNIFREYDIRGLADSELTPEVMRFLGKGMATAFRRLAAESGRDGGDPSRNGASRAAENAGGVSARRRADGVRPRVLVGRDNRLSSDALRDALVESFVSEGFNVVDIGTVITPLFYYALLHTGIDAGAMITASHNPPEYNGIKVAFGPGTLYGDQIQQIGRLARQAAEREAAGEPATANAASPAPMGEKGTVERVDAAPAYVEMLADKLELGSKRLKVAVDCGNGTGGLFAEAFLKRLGCEVIPLFCESDGTFPNHEADPTRRENLHDLMKAVKEHGADVGIAFDGDSDRIGAVDDKGEVLWGDQLMSLYWREILPKHPGAWAIIEVKCSQALVDEVERLGGRPVFYKTGHSLIKAKMRELGAVFTGEMSGHMFFADEYYGYDDAFYAAGRLLRILSNSDEPLSAMRESLPHYFSTAETRIPVRSDAAKFDVVKALTKQFEGEHEVIDVDGARVLFGDGWGLMRASNTQPAIVARCEGKTPEALDRIKRTVKEALDAFDEVEAFEWAE